MQRLESLREWTLTAERALLYTMGFNFAILHPQVFTRPSLLSQRFKLSLVLRFTCNFQVKCSWLHTIFRIGWESSRSLFLRARI